MIHCDTMSQQNRSKQARVVIELLCKILDENNISTTRAETLRQAKFDNDAAVRPMALLLLNVIQLCDDKQTSTLDMPVTDEQRMIFIKTKLQSWGYLSRSFACLSNTLSNGSRELLLALGWLMHQKHFVEKVIEQRLNPLHQHIIKFVKDQDDCRASETQEPSIDQSRDQQLPLGERIQHHMLLTGKLRMAMRRLHSVYQHSANITQTIHKSTEGISLQTRLNHLTPLEVYVIRHPSCLKKLLDELEKDNTELEHLLEWKQKEDIFWEWMDSVLTAHTESASRGASACSDVSLLSCSPGVESVFLAVPSNVGEQLEKARTELRDFILSHEDDMGRMEEILNARKISQVEKEVHKMHMDKEITHLVEQLRRCAFTEEEKDKTRGTDDHSQIAAEDKAALLEPKKNRRHRPFEFTDQHEEILSPYALKVSRQSALKQQAHEELSNLSEEVAKLEVELQQAQMRNIQQIQTVINKEENFICIQPRTLQHMFE